MEEKWVKLASCWDTDSVNYSDSYLVSNKGDVMSINAVWKDGRKRPPKILSKNDNNHGYLIVSLNRNKRIKTLTVHQIVYYSFNGGCPCGRSTVVDHVDNDKTNNSLENLQLISHTDNVRKSIDTSKTATGQMNIWIREDGKYTIGRQHKRKRKRYGSFKTLEEAIAYRDMLIKNNWNLQ